MRLGLQKRHTPGIMILLLMIYRKCNGISEFTQGEIQKIVDFLNLETPMGIFFDVKVS